MGLLPFVWGVRVQGLGLGLRKGLGFRANCLGRGAQGFP